MPSTLISPACRISGQGTDGYIYSGSLVLVGENVSGENQTEIQWEKDILPCLESLSVLQHRLLISIHVIIPGRRREEEGRKNDALPLIQHPDQWSV